MDFEGSETVSEIIEKDNVVIDPIPVLSNMDLWNSKFSDTLANILFKKADIDKELAGFETFLKNADFKNKE